MRFLDIRALLTITVISGSFFSCNGPTGEVSAEGKDSLVVKMDVPLFDINAMGNDPGIAGVFEVPEMLSLCKLDSGRMSELSQKVIEGFATLEKDMIELGVEMKGPQGMIYYSTNPDNFKFETVLLINKMPVKTPKNCQIVILEASYMLVYNYIGPYQNVSASYDVIKKYLDHNNYKQSGPAREFYPLVPGSETDPSKLLTRIMVPVVKIKS